MTNEIEIHPEYSDLTKKINKLKEEILKKILEEDELIHHTCKNIEAEYMLKLGCLEYKIFKKETNIAMLKRKIELIQKQINLQEEVNLDEIQEKVDLEFEEIIFKIKKEASDLNSLTDRLNSENLSKKDNEKLKKLYKKLIFKLHPDLNDNLTKEEEELFFKVVEAYENGDLLVLNLLYELNIDELDKKEKEKNSLDKLKEEEKLLKIRINLLNKNIEKIKNSHPYNKLNLLNDEPELNKTKEELENKLNTLNKYHEEYSEKLEKLIGELNVKR